MLRICFAGITAKAITEHMEHEAVDWHDRSIVIVN